MESTLELIKRNGFLFLWKKKTRRKKKRMKMIVASSMFEQINLASNQNVQQESKLWLLLFFYCWFFINIVHKLKCLYILWWRGLWTVCGKTPKQVFNLVSPPAEVRAQNRCFQKGTLRKGLFGAIIRQKTAVFTKHLFPQNCCFAGRTTALILFNTCCLPLVFHQSMLQSPSS